MHQSRVDAERHVVQKETLVRAADVDAPLRSAERAERSKRIVTVEAQIACEMVTGPEGNTDERGVAFEHDAGDRRQRAVASGHAQHLGRRGAGQLRRVLAFLQDVALDTDRACLAGELVGVGRALAGTRIDEEEGGQGRPD
jgi:hypothetical protein